VIFLLLSLWKEKELSQEEVAGDQAEGGNLVKPLNGGSAGGAGGASGTRRTPHLLQ